jgi:sigma-B regulation protein RsbU (phosphoserine phosphatase)
LDRDLPGIRISALHQAAYDDSLVGGDFYDLMPIGNGRYGVMIGDVSGKGLEAAVYTAMARYMIQAYFGEDPDPEHVIAELNSALCGYIPVGRFVTLVYGILDTNADTFSYINAGHESPLLHTGSDGKVEYLQSSGPAVGALAEAAYATTTIDFQPGDMLIFYTNGATDARCEGKFLGADGIRKIVTTHIRKSAHDLPAAVVSSIRNYANGYLSDDVAIFVIERYKPGALF